MAISLCVWYMGKGGKGHKTKASHKHQLYYDSRDYTISHIDPWDDRDTQRDSWISDVCICWLVHHPRIKQVKRQIKGQKVVVEECKLLHMYSEWVVRNIYVYMCVSIHPSFFFFLISGSPYLFPLKMSLFVRCRSARIKSLAQMHMSC